MKGLCILRRGYATKGPKPTINALAAQLNRSYLPDGVEEPTPDAPVEPPKGLLENAAAVARRGSTPIAVRIRRIKANRDQVKTSLTASEEDTYARLRSTNPGREDLDSPSLWAKALYDRRSRIRGLEEVAPDDNSPDVLDLGENMGYGSGRVRIIGKRIYLPNIVIQFIRNRTLSGKPYNPYEATFRIPKNLTKHDLRSYLYFVYGVKTNYIRTDNYIGKFKRLGKSRTKVRERGGTYKRAVVGLVDPFYPPDMLEDMAPPERKALKKVLETDFYLKDRKTMVEEQIEFGKHPRTALGDKATVFRPGLATSRAKIMAKVLEKRKEREKTIKKEIEQLTKEKKGVRLQL